MKIASRIPGWLAAAALAASPGHGAGIRCGTEFRYPTSYELSPIMVFDANGNARFAGAVVAPRDFVTRTVGVTMEVYASIVTLVASADILATEEHKRLHGNTDLMIAATRGDLPAVRRLLARGAAVNARNRFGSTALMGAAAGGFADVAAVLLRCGALPDCRAKDGSTALLFAARNGHTGVVDLLLTHGAAIDRRDRDRQTALLYAVSEGHRDVAETLVRHGADVETPSRHGTSPLTLASARRDSDFVLLLIRAGAEP